MVSTAPQVPTDLNQSRGKVDAAERDGISQQRGNEMMQQEESDRNQVTELLRTLSVLQHVVDPNPAYPAVPCLTNTQGSPTSRHAAALRTAMRTVWWECGRARSCDVEGAEDPAVEEKPGCEGPGGTGPRKP